MLSRIVKKGCKDCFQLRLEVIILANTGFLVI